MKTTYLLGAGFTHAIHNNAPLNKDILDMLSLQGHQEIQHLVKESGSDIEYLLTLLDLKIAKFNGEPPEINDIKNKILKQIYNIFNIDKLNTENSINSQLLFSFVQSMPCDSSIISLNYDCILDQGLWLGKVWSPCCGYAIRAFPAQCNCDSLTNQKNLKLLKPHGSCNFFSDKESQYFKININDKIFPGVSSEINQPRNNDIPCLALMSYDKQYKNGMFSLWKEAICALKASDKLVVIGCSLRGEDAFLRYALYNFGARENVDELQIEIVDHTEENCINIEKKLKELVAHPNECTYKYYPQGLKEYILK